MLLKHENSQLYVSMLDDAHSCSHIYYSEVLLRSLHAFQSVSCKSGPFRAGSGDLMMLAWPRRRKASSGCAEASLRMLRASHGASPAGMGACRACRPLAHRSGYSYWILHTRAAVRVGVDASMQACKLKLHACAVLWCRATTMIDDAFNHLYNGKPDLVDKRFQEARSAGACSVGPARY